MWRRYTGPDAPPLVVSVASSLWDVARLWGNENATIAASLQIPELGLVDYATLGERLRDMT